jgi:precorrin-6x reductase
MQRLIRSTGITHALEIARACERVCKRKGIVFVNLKREGLADRVLAKRILSALKLGECCEAGVCR